MSEVGSSHQEAIQQHLIQAEIFLLLLTVATAEHLVFFAFLVHLPHGGRHLGGFLFRGRHSGHGARERHLGDQADIPQLSSTELQVFFSGSSPPLCIVDVVNSLSVVGIV